ncbi:SHOCT domain-containing protein [Cyanobium sp. CH-040]|uniref:SHOCT domain-containing protein n=1 Tax=Cyanobium sp. CH-040 TaxID=2823708 RepID=UPI0020CBE503|nr:SHOCT domain-containing protein [Cyanobium sp. CH-040]MCP9927003.1 SHOCT domain-containing protein [Cyanobium sp. CH-040]
MEQITPQGLQVAQDLGQRHGFSAGAVAHLMQAMLRSRGGMAQFNHPEFGGSGQWMPGGMLMISDMFNNALKARVDGLCRDVSAVLASQPMSAPAVSHSFQQQSGGGFQQQSSGGAAAAAMPGMAPMASMAPMPGMAPMASSPAAPLFVPDPRDTWWPPELGTPSASGEQNSVRYAFFPGSGRLAVDVNGQVSVYDTGGQHIAGFGQQQAGGGVVFTTPAGHVSLSSFSPAGGFSQQQQSGGGSQQQSTGGGWQQQSSSAASVSQAAATTPMPPMGSMQPPAGMSMAPMSPMAPIAPPHAWWPAELGTPASSGAQNDLRYAVFPAIGRLAVEQGGRCRVFAVGPEQIRGVAVQSDSGALMVATADGERPLDQFPQVTPAAEPDDPYAALERLGELRAKGILTEEEFDRKKADLLARL